MTIAEIVVATIVNVILPRRIAELEGITEGIDGTAFQPRLWAAQTATAYVAEDGKVWVNCSGSVRAAVARSEAEFLLDLALCEIPKDVEAMIFDCHDMDYHGAALAIR